MANTDDIRTTGPIGLKGLSAEQRERIRQSRQMANQAFLGRYNPPIENTSEVQRYSPDEAMASWGTSKYDNPIQPTYLTADQMQDVRHENQSSWDVLANGVGKMLGKAGTTFLSSLVGLPYGVATAIGEQRWSGLWDNAVTQGLSDVDKWMEDNLVNYKSTEQQNSPWYSLSNLGSMNFWADDVITNAGFTLGAAASMAVGAGTMGLLSKSLGFVNKVSKGGKMANNLISSLFSATGEGMIEAKQGVEERNKAELVNLENSLMPERQALEEEYRLINEEYAANKGQSLVADSEGRAVDPAYEKYTQQMAILQQKRDLLQQKYDAGKRQIEESGKAMGNKILLGNQVLLTAGNLLQFGKAMTKSYDAARHAAETSSKIAKPFGVTAERVSSNIADGYKVAGKAFGRAIVAPKNFFKEGFEEMNQQFIQSTAGAAYNEKDVNDYWRAKLDEKSYREATKSMYELGNIISQGFKDSYGNGDQWEQFFIGGLTGLSGSYVPTKLFNQDKTKSRLDPRRYGEWSGGFWQDIGDFNKQYNQFEENINDLNTVLQQEDFHRRMQSMAARTYAENRKNEAAANDDKKTWKDEDDKQNIHDIQAFYRAGKIDDLRAIYENMGEQLSDEDVESILKSTSRVITAEEDKKEHDTAIDNQIAEKQNEINKYYDEIESLQTGLLGSVQDVREENREYVIKQSDDLFGKINSAEQEIERLKQEKDAYKGRRYFEGTYIDSEGNKTTDYNKIREDVKHNSEELQRKLDSYLESIAYVNERTNGQLTKDQEDNLAYLHNMKKESLNRADKILSNVRKSLPQKFLLKTTKSPEQLAQENASSNLTFTKEDNTPEGYVEVDTSLMNDKSFSDFFIRDILWGGNIRKEFGETADEKARREEEEKNLSEEERGKRRTAKWKRAWEEAKNNAQEQKKANVNLMVNNFIDNYKRDNRATEVDTYEALGEMLQDIADAHALTVQAGEFELTLQEYIRNPGRVEEDKAKEEKKAAKKSKEETQKNKFAGKTAKEINQDIADGNITIDDAEDFAVADLSDVTDEDSKAALQTAQQEAKKSKDIRQKQAEIKGAILNNAEENGWNEASVDAALNAVDTMAANAEDAADINLDNVGDFINPADVEGASTGEDEMADLSQQVQDMIASGLNSWKESQDKKEDIPDTSTAVSFSEETEDTGHDSTTKIPADTAAPKVETAQNKDEWEQPVPTNTLTSTAANKIEEEVNKEDSGTYQSAPWRSTTRRYGRQRIFGNRWGTADVPYHELITDKDSTKYKRSKAIWDYLNDDKVKAWDHVDTAGKDRIRVGDAIHFMVRNFAEKIFGKSFEDLSEEEKPYALVTLMLDDGGRILGDLPLAQFERGYNDDTSLIKSPQLKELKTTQEKLFKAFEEKRKKTGCNEAVADKGINKEGAENLNLTFNNSRKSPFVSKISQILNGIVPFGNEINTLNDIMGNEDLLLGISVTGETIATSRDKKDRRGGAARPIRVANIGQAYILIPSPSGALMPVPFYTKPFNAQNHAGTQLYKILGEAVANLINNADKDDTSSYKESMDVLEGLLQVRAQEGARSTVETTIDNVTLHLQSLTNPNQKIDIRVPNTGNVQDAVTAILNNLNGTPINISLQFINSKIGVKNGISASYNRVIGEIADANLPKDTHHTVNNAFLIKLTTDAGTQRTEVRYQQSGTQTFSVGDRNVKVDIDKFIAYSIDPATKEETIIEGDEEVNKLLADIKASQQADKTKPFKIELDGQIRTYDPVKKEFVRTSQGSGINAGEASINQQKEDRKNAPAPQVAPKTIFKTSTVENKQGAKILSKGMLIADKVGDNSTYTTGTVNGKKVFYPSAPLSVVRTSANQQSFFLMDKSTATATEAGGYVVYEPGEYEERNGAIVVTKEAKIGYYKNSPDELVGETTSTAATIPSAQPETKAQSTKKPEVPIMEYWESLEILGGKDIPQALREAGYSEEEIQKAVQEKATAEQPVERKANTIEEIEKEVGEAGIINRRNKDAWDAISDSLKLKMVNEGVGIVLEYSGNEVTLDYRNFDDMKNKLKDANKYAKSNSMTAREGAKYRRVKSAQERKADIRKEKEWLQKNLPMFSTEDRLHFVQGLLEIPGEKNWAWGRFEKGIITLSDMTARGTLYHEAFHAVTQTLLSDEQLNELYKAGVKHYNEVDEALIEELLAEDFRRYVQRGETPIIGPILKFFRKIMNAIRNITGYRAPIQQLFYQVNNGKFSESIPKKTRVGNAFYQRVRTDRLQPESNPMAQKIRANFNRMNWRSTGRTKKEVQRDMQRLGKQWTKFKEAWMKEDGYVPVGEWSYNAFGEDKPGYIFHGVRTLQDEVISLRESRRKAAKTLTAAKQAVKGIDAFSRWYNLNQEEKDVLTRFKLNQYRWNNMSVEERQQWQKCHGV